MAGWPRATQSSFCADYLNKRSLSNITGAYCRRPLLKHTGKDMRFLSSQAPPPRFPCLNFAGKQQFELRLCAKLGEENSADTASESSTAEERSSGEASTSGKQNKPIDLAELVDAEWSDLPLDQMRRPWEIGWDIDPAGPTGAERFDNVYHKRQQDLNSTAIDIIGMGSWRLKTVAGPIIQIIVANIEGAWRHLIDDLGLYPLPKEWRYVDSLDPEGEYGSWSYQDLEPPAKDAPGWPRLQIENRCYQSRVFRKLHMEVAHRQDGLEVFHCVIYPRPDFDLPILSMDLVAKDNRVSLAIIDPCPVAMDRSLPQIYNQTASVLQKEYGVENNRAMPDWGREIFSEHCIMMRPESTQALAAFLKYMIALMRVHLRFAINADPIKQNRASRMHVIAAAQKRYSEKQLLNSKTRRVLESSFSPEFAERYMSGLMFDTAPKQQQANAEGSQAQTRQEEGASRAAVSSVTGQSAGQAGQ